MNMIHADLSFLAAIIVGLLGSLHCVGMCGGISAALMHAVPTAQRRSSAGSLGYALSFSLGRITTYALAGAVAALFGSLFVSQLMPAGPSLLRILAGVMMILLGLYISGWWPILHRLEQAGKGIWRRLQPLTRSLMPVTTPLQAFLLGALWGWLPCGLVYSALAWSLAAGSVAEGTWLMLGFGLGTVPAMVATGMASQQLLKFAQQIWVRRLAGLSLIIYGLWTLYSPLIGMQHHHNHTHSSQYSAQPSAQNSIQNTNSSQAGETLHQSEHDHAQHQAH